MPRTFVAYESALKNGEGKTVHLLPGLSAYVFRYQDQWRGFVNRCPHMGGSVSLDARTGACVCAWHEASFDALTGERCTGQAPEGSALTRLTVDVQGGEVWVHWERPTDPFAF